jgi:hypothetical protein
MAKRKLKYKYATRDVRLSDGRRIKAKKRLPADILPEDLSALREMKVVKE